MKPDFPFTTDGCSGQVYRTLAGRAPPWEGCCVEHDRAYWMGGTEEQRLSADERLRECIKARGHPVVANIVYRTVRATGHPMLPTTWRWGYGWTQRGYRSE